MTQHDPSGLRRLRDADLRNRNTFAVAARAPLLIEVAKHSLLPGLFEGELAGGAMVLGGGSNLLFANDPTMPLVALTGRRSEVLGETDDRTVVRAEAGTGWHDLVMWTLEQGLSGLQNLALIPGTVGAAPIQNIGAYGVEVADCIHAVEAFDRRSGAFVRLGRDACDFAYRDSRFKREADAWIVTAVQFALSREAAVRTDYAGLAEELVAMGVQAPSPRTVAEAVVRIRRRKLPDPARIGNAGSFFKNPIVPLPQADALKAADPDLPVYPVQAFPADAAASGGSPGARAKLSAAWLIEQCGWKGYRDGDAGVSDRHALVLVNHGNATGAQLLDVARRIAASVQERFGVALEPEPRIVGERW